MTSPCQTDGRKNGAGSPGGYCMYTRGVRFAPSSLTPPPFCLHVFWNVTTIFILRFVTLLRSVQKDGFWPSLIRRRSVNTYRRPRSVKRSNQDDPKTATSNCGLFWRCFNQSCAYESGLSKRERVRKICRASSIIFSISINYRLSRF